MGPLDLNGPPFGGPLNPYIGCSRCWGHSLDLEHSSHWSLWSFSRAHWLTQFGQKKLVESGESWVRSRAGELRQQAALHLGPGQAGRAACHEAQCDARSCATRRSVQPDYKASHIKARPQLQKQRCKVKASKIEEISWCRALKRARNLKTWYHRYSFDPINLFANIISTDQKELFMNPEMCLKVVLLTWNVGSKPKNWILWQPYFLTLRGFKIRQLSDGFFISAQQLAESRALRKVTLRRD